MEGQPCVFQTLFNPMGFITSLTWPEKDGARLWITAWTSWLCCSLLWSSPCVIIMQGIDSPRLINVLSTLAWHNGDVSHVKPLARINSTDLSWDTSNSIWIGTVINQTRTKHLMTWTIKSWEIKTLGKNSWLHDHQEYQRSYMKLLKKEK